MEGFPLSPGELERYRVTAKKRASAGQVGAHLIRRRGQSLEFHDYAQYSPGDDYRHIDWRASARLRRPRELVVRRFEAAEQLTLAISVDNRPSMHLLPDACKLRLACWLAYALAAVAATEGDRILLHRLFGPSEGSVQELVGPAVLPRARSFLEGLIRRPAPEDAVPSLRPLVTRLPPAAVWLILTDLYFEDPDARVARTVTQAQRGLRWVILLELDNWPQERAVLGIGARRVDGPGLGTKHLRVEIDAAGVEKVRQKIAAHKNGLLRRMGRGGLSPLRWSWPSSAEVDLASLFLDRFHGEPVLRRLFRRVR